MITFENLSKKPRIFKGFTGVSVAEFEELLESVRPVWEKRERQRLSRPKRQRAIGGGRKPVLGLRGQLLLTLVWLRLYLTTEALGYLFGIDKATVSRYTRRMSAALCEVGEATLGWPEPPKRGKSIEEVRETHPDLFAFVDATEQPVRRSKDYETQKKHYSGKKKRHTRKVQIVVNEEGIVRDVSRSVPGSMHDRRLFTQSGVANKIPKEVVVGGDAGYQGIQKDLPDHSVVTPFKRSKNHPLNEEQKWLNREFARGRIVVENTIAAFKHFKALAEVFRHAVALWDEVFRAVLAIVNPRLQKRVNAASAA